MECLGISVANLLENKFAVTKQVLLGAGRRKISMENRYCNAGNDVTPSGWEKESLKKENKQTNVSFDIHEDQTISTVIQENRRMYSVIHKKCGTKKDYSKSTGIKNDQTISPAPYQRTISRVTSSHSRSNSVLDKLYCKYSHQIARTQSRSSFTSDEETRQRLTSRR